MTKSALWLLFHLLVLPFFFIFILQVFEAVRQCLSRLIPGYSASLCCCYPVTLKLIWTPPMQQTWLCWLHIFAFALNWVWAHQCKFEPFFNWIHALTSKGKWKGVRRVKRCLSRKSALYVCKLLWAEDIEIWGGKQLLICVSALQFSSVLFPGFVSTSFHLSLENILLCQLSKNLSLQCPQLAFVTPALLCTPDALSVSKRCQGKVP